MSVEQWWQFRATLDFYGIIGFLVICVGLGVFMSAVSIRDWWRRREALRRAMEGEDG